VLQKHFSIWRTFTFRKYSDEVKRFASETTYIGGVVDFLKESLMNLVKLEIMCFVTFISNGIFLPTSTCCNFASSCLFDKNKPTRHKYTLRIRTFAYSHDRNVGSSGGIWLASLEHTFLWLFNGFWDTWEWDTQEKPAAFDAAKRHVVSRPATQPVGHNYRQTILFGSFTCVWWVYFHQTDKNSQSYNTLKLVRKYRSKWMSRNTFSQFHKIP